MKAAKGTDSAQRAGVMPQTYHFDGSAERAAH